MVFLVLLKFPLIALSNYMIQRFIRTYAQKHPPTHMCGEKMIKGQIANFFQISHRKLYMQSSYHSAGLLALMAI